jgi:phosphoribosylamine-glycine ligase
MKLLIIDTDGVGLSWAWRAAEAGHAVKWFIDPKPTNNRDTGRGFKGIEKVDNWVGHAKWADLIISTSNDKYVEKLDSLRKAGFPVFGPSVASAQLEISRADGMQLMESVGIKTAPYKTFKTMAIAKKHVEQTKERFVFKTLGDNEDKSLTYVSKSPADLIGWMERIISRGDQPKGDVMLQTFIKGIELGVSRFMGSKGFVGQYNESFEHKKLMSGNHGPNCYSADSEVLTESGWKYWPDVKMADKICTLKNGNIEFENPSLLTVADHDGYLIGWKSPYVDLLVTPGHQMYVQDSNGRKDFQFESANITESHSRKILRGSGAWCGLDENNDLPYFYKGGFAEWCSLLGAYIADGNVNKKTVVFGNCPTHKQKEFKEICKRAGYNAKMYGAHLCINSKNLADYFKKLGKAGDKYAPSYVKNASRKSIKAFLLAYEMGDGSRRKNNSSFTTISKRLANDLQELCLKAGWSANISVRDRRDEPPHMINGYACYNRSIAYEIRVSKEKLKSNLKPSMSYRENYTGKVYCCTVTSHVIYVRRNGKSCFLGQTGEMGTIAYFTPESKLGDETLGLLEKQLVALGHTGDVALGFMIDEDGTPWPTEWTCRFGWPIANMMLGATEGDPVEWMRDALDGKDTTSFKEDIGCCVVLAHGDFPHGNLTKKEVSGVPIYGITKGNKRHLHPQSVKIDELPDMNGEEIVTRPVWNTSGDYVAVVTGYGKDIQQACTRAYKTVDQLHISNMIVRDDIGEGMEEQLPKLHKMGYALHCEYSHNSKHGMEHK